MPYGPKNTVLVDHVKTKTTKQVAETKTDEKLIVKINIVKKTGTQLFRLLPTLT